MKGTLIWSQSNAKGVTNISIGSDGHLYAYSKKGRPIYVLKKSDGNLVKLIDQNNSDFLFKKIQDRRATPFECKLFLDVFMPEEYAFNSVSSSGALYLTKGESLIATDTDKLSPLTESWRFNAGSTFFSSPILSNNGVVYICCRDATVHGLWAAKTDKPSPGLKIWEFKASSLNKRGAKPAISKDGMIYITCYDGKIYALKTFGNNSPVPPKTIITKPTSPSNATPKPVASSRDLLAYYSFNGSANDMSGNGNHGIVYGATLSTDRFGRANRSYAFNGKSHILIKNNLLPSGASSRTISAWVKTYQSDIRFILGWGTLELGAVGFGNRHGFSTNSKWYAWSGSGGTDGFDLAGPRVTLNKWTHLASTYDPPLYKFYCNGALVSSSRVSLNTLKTNILMIGSGTSAHKKFDGSIDEITIYKRALTAKEIEALYRSKN